MEHKKMIITRLLPSQTDEEESSGLVSASKEREYVLGPSFDWKAAILPFLFPAIGGLLFGFDSGATSGAIISLKDPALSGTDWSNMSATATGLVVSGSLCGALIGSALAFVIADTFGRRRELLLAASLYFCGGVFMATCPSLQVLILGRLLYGLGIGLAMHGASIYIGETSPAPIRGLLVSLGEALTVCGILLGYLAGYAFSDTPSGWRLIYAATLPLAATMTAGVFSLPPSPRWLLLRAAKAEAEAEEEGGAPGGAEVAAGLRESARSALRRLRGPRIGEEDLRGELLGMEGAPAGQGDEKGGGGAAGAAEASHWSDLTSEGNLQALVIGAGLVFFQQVTGQPSVLYYAAPILQDAGFDSVKDATRVSVFLGVSKVIMTVVAVATVDHWGRRPLLLTGVSGMVCSLGVLSSFYLFDNLLPPAMAVASLLFYVGFYQISFGPISWILVSEIFPLKVRGRALSIATFINFGTNSVVAFSLPTIQGFLGQGGSFLTFAVIGVVAVIFIFLKVPETKGLSLEEIEAQMLQ